ncbi:hypothetical protein [Acetivibrio cellulolyticus]|uniref:hypothetical protein n=1 Tax=Acetivibrio cellulolyticus TaxID=35830 RepID=UPI0001E2F66A|nr:hypothetical protein [Acetivibrio cellulolyticus]
MTEIDIMILEQQLWYAVYQKACTDKEFRKEMLEDATAAVEKVLMENWGLTRKDLPLPEDFVIKAIEAKPDTYYQIAPYIDKGNVTIPQDVKIEQLEETASVRFFVMPSE